jgi:hypothetical protein
MPSRHWLLSCVGCFLQGDIEPEVEAQPGQAHIVARLEAFAKIEEAFLVQTLGHL